jgi:hypothetical protein
MKKLAVSIYRRAKLFCDNAAKHGRSQTTAARNYSADAGTNNKPATYLKGRVA